MNNSQLNRVINLIKKTGDRCVVLDKGSEHAMVMMNLDEYEEILELSECTCLCGDNEQEVEGDYEMEIPEEPVKLVELGDDFSPVEEAEEEGLAIPEDKEDDPVLMDPSELEGKDEKVHNFANIGQEEKLDDVPLDEADRFYLEPVDE